MAQIKHPAGPVTGGTYQARRSHAADRNLHQPHVVALACRCNDQQARRKMLVFTGSKTRQFIVVRPAATPAIPAGIYGSCHG